MPNSDKEHMETQTAQSVVKKFKEIKVQKGSFMCAKFRYWCLCRKSAQYLENKFIISMQML